MITIITHNRKFHADEVVGYAILQILYGQANLLRVGYDENIELFIRRQGLTGKVFVLDVGRELSEDANISWIDHHQCTITRANGNVLATAGLVWDRYGRGMLAKLGVKEGCMDSIWQTIDSGIIAPIDAIDADPNYRVRIECSGERLSMPSISAFIGRLNGNPDDEYTQLAQFRKAASFIEDVLVAEVRELKHSESQKQSFIESLTQHCDHFLLSDTYHGGYRDLVWGSDYSDIWYIAMKVEAGKYMCYAMPKSVHDRAPKYPILDLSDFRVHGGFIHENKFCASGDYLSCVDLIKANIEYYRNGR